MISKLSATIVPASKLPQRAIPLQLVSGQNKLAPGSARSVDMRRRAVRNRKHGRSSHPRRRQPGLPWLVTMTRHRPPNVQVALDSGH